MDIFCIRLIDFMLNGKSLLSYTNLISPNYYEKNDKIIKKLLLWIYFWNVVIRKIYCAKV